MRVLYFAPKESWPPTTGALVRNYFLARELARSAGVTFLAFSDDTNLNIDPAGRPRGTIKESGGNEAGAMDWCEQAISVQRERDYTAAKLVRGAIGRLPVTVLNYKTRAMAEELERTLDQQNFDVVQVESIHLAPYLPIIRSARCRPLAVCDWHNIESDLMRQYSNHAPSFLRRAYARRTASQLSAVERQAARGFDVHLTCTDPDRTRLLQFAPGARTYVIPNGVDTNYFSDEQIGQAHFSRDAGNGDSKPVSEPRRHRVLFVGSMDYHANVDAAVEFAHSVWPRISERRRDLVFTIVGRNPPPKVRELASLPAIEVTGTVKDVRPYYREAVASLVPLRVGGGSRLKILEAMAAGVPVISTRLGAEGIEVQDGENILFAETGDEFCRRVSEICDSEMRWRKLAGAGRELAQAKYDWAGLGDTLAGIYAELLRNRNGS
jgi:polysaccharide biosynthesis protein PslH